MTTYGLRYDSDVGAEGIQIDSIGSHPVVVHITLGQDAP